MDQTGVVITWLHPPKQYSERQDHEQFYLHLPEKKTEKLLEVHHGTTQALFRTDPGPRLIALKNFAPCNVRVRLTLAASASFDNDLGL